MSRRSISTAVILVACLCLSALAQTTKKPAVPPKRPPQAKAAAEPVKIAEGRYELLDVSGESGKFSDDWELWKTSTGEKVVEHWSVQARGAASPVEIRLELELIAGHAVTVRVFGKQVNDRDLECRLTMDRAICSVGTQRKEVEVSGNYDFFLPSPWLLRAVIKRSSKQPDQPTPVKLLRMGGIGPDGPQLMVHDAKVQYIGEDDVEVAGTRRPCDIFELQPDPHPRMLIWVEKKTGMVVVTQDAKKSQQRIELVRYSAAGGRP